MKDKDYSGAGMSGRSLPMVPEDTVETEAERHVKILREVVRRYIKNEEASNEGVVSEEMWPIHNAAKMLVGQTNCPRWDSEAAGEGMEQLKREVFGTE